MNNSVDDILEEATNQSLCLPHNFVVKKIHETMINDLRTVVSPACNLTIDSLLWNGVWFPVQGGAARFIEDHIGRPI